MPVPSLHANTSLPTFFAPSSMVQFGLLVGQLSGTGTAAHLPKSFGQVPVCVCDERHVFCTAATIAAVRECYCVAECYGPLILSFFLPVFTTASLAQWLWRPPRKRKIWGVRIPLAPGFFRSNHTSDFKTGTPVATLPGAWRYRVRAGTGLPGVSIL